MRNRVTDIWQERLGRFAASALEGAADHRAWQFTLIGRARLKSQVFFAQQVSTGRRLLIKACTLNQGIDGGGDRADVQYQALRDAWRAMPEGGDLRVPEPIACDAPQGLLAMEWINGAPLTNLLIDPHTALAEKLARVQQAARWLALFHGATTSDRGCLDPSMDLADVEASFAAESSPPLIKHEIERQRSSATAVAQCAVANGWVHGDFKADNLLASGRTLYGIDFGPRRRNLILYDLASFLNHLRTISVYPNRKALASVVPALEATFVQAYETHSTLVPLHALLWLRRLQILEAYFDVHRQTGFLASAKRALRRHFMKRVLAALAADSPSAGF